MGRILAIDYGRKRTGIAVTDNEKIIANGLTTIPGDKVIDFLSGYVTKENIERIVIGLPKKLNNEPSENMRHVEAFVNRLKKILPDIPCEYFDERFTSVMAHQAMIDGGIKKIKRRDKSLVDKISAVLILQGYLEKTKFNLKL
jgi:putative Holliday junction resolvase